MHRFFQNPQATGLTKELFVCKSDGVQFLAFFSLSQRDTAGIRSQRQQWPEIYHFTWHSPEKESDMKQSNIT